eukprot:TRINITY_DN11803_c0_g1_i1.p1 TRINITY_DN11803_c0_g1~~TRINITY_DN11803_c0_g1_i1.p1  ORF type:complete len:548 (+),score=176.20 TRINITY_DN11803_c0_g1_i1:35-1645(+)
MSKIIECVPNFSEGRNKKTIEAIANAIKNTPGCSLLDYDPGQSTNRTVYTFVGSPEAVVNGAFNAIQVGKELIDMKTHSGEHPRFGACDVCPFIPVQGATMDDCVACAEKLGARMGSELGLPVYLYEYAAKADYRRLLPDVRKGEYEGIAGRITEPEWKPDFGPAEFVPSWGVTAVGARKFLIAYNVNLLGTKQQAHRIALNIRENGRKDEPGRLKSVKGIGWYVDEYNMAQVSVNIIDYEITGMHTVFEECAKDARELNLAVVGSEVIGCLPLNCLLKAADYYMEKEGLFLVDERQKVRLAVERMGLSSIVPFNPDKRVIEYMIDNSGNEPLCDMSLRAFIREVGARSSAPGGGSVSAAVGALGAGLTTMVGWLTYGYRKYEDLDAEMRRLITPLHQGMERLLPMIDADTNAFDDYMKAMKLPKTDPEKREAAMQAGLKVAIDTPLTTMRIIDSLWDHMADLAKVGNFTAKSDMQVGAKSCETGLWGAYQNVLINMKDITDEEYKEKTLKEAAEMNERAIVKCREILEIVDARES